MTNAANPVTADPIATAPSLSATPVDAPAAPFPPAEIAAFVREDAEAGRFIGRILCTFFAYTIVVAALAAWWTWESLR